MRITRIILTLTISSFLLACNKRVEVNETTNMKPQVTLTPVLGTDSVKGTTRIITYNYEVTDEANSYSISFSGNSGKYYINGQEVTRTGIALTDKQGTVGFQANSLGANEVSFSFTDIYGKDSTIKKDITCFSNLTPVANLTYTKVGSFNLLEYTLDASSSFDRDEKYGGMIIEYEYQIDLTDPRNTANNRINHIFSEEGVYTIKVRGKDNDGVWSAWKTVIANIN